MKIETRTFNILATFALAFLLIGCATISPSADPIVVRTEQTLSVAFSTFDTFLKIEHDNSERIKKDAPKVHEFAEWLRFKTASGESRGLAIIRSADSVKNAYKANRTPENRANLLTAVLTLESAVGEAQKHLTEIK